MFVDGETEFDLFDACVVLGMTMIKQSFNPDIRSQKPLSVLSYVAIKPLQMLNQDPEM